MNKLITLETIIIIALIILICAVPSRHISAYQETSVNYEHTKSVDKAVSIDTNDNSDDLSNPSEDDNSDNNDNEPDDTEESSVVAVSRAVGGYNAYVSGSFAEPTPFPEEADEGDDTTGDGGNTGDAADTGDAGSGDDGEAGSDASTDKSEDETVTDTKAEVTWTKTAAEDGTRAAALGNLYFRTTPSKQDDDNIMLTIPEGETFDVISSLVESTDPDVKNWLEIKYDGKTGFVVKKYTEIKE